MRTLEEVVEDLREEYPSKHQIRLLSEILKIYKAEQRPKGHWTKEGYCSECGCDVPSYVIDWQWQKYMDAKYCPMCGAKMVKCRKARDKE